MNAGESVNGQTVNPKAAINDVQRGGRSAANPTGSIRPVPAQFDGSYELERVPTVRDSGAYNGADSTSGFDTTPGLRRMPVSRAPQLSPAPQLDLTVVIPTRNEGHHVEVLLARLHSELRSVRAEVLFVDESDDETPVVIRDAANRSDGDVRMLHREPGHRDGRLGGAVVAGLQLARAPWAVVMNGDLRHPPEAILTLLGAGRSPDVDLVYGTPTSNSSGPPQSAHRRPSPGRTGRLTSWLLIMATKLLFPRALRGVSDPLSGFFAIRVGALDLSLLRPAGYHVLIEILTQSRLRRAVGVGYPARDGTDELGGSGSTGGGEAAGEDVRFLGRLLWLRLTQSARRLEHLTAFFAVGASGVVVNTLGLWLLSAAWLQLPYLVASAVATNVAILWNFCLLEAFVFAANGNRSRPVGFLRFWLLNAALLPVQLGLLAILVEQMAVKPILANVLALALVFILRYVFTSNWVYRGYDVSAAGISVVPTSAQGTVATPTSRARREASPVRAMLGIHPVRLALPALVTVVAFPASAVRSWQLMTSGGLAALGLMSVLIAAILIAVLRAAPRPGEPNVHDRQLFGGVHGGHRRGDFNVLTEAAGASHITAHSCWVVRTAANGLFVRREWAQRADVDVVPCAGHQSAHFVDQ